MKPKKKPTTVAELREYLGMEPGQLLENSNGAVADILAVDGDDVVLGVLHQSQPIRVPLINLLPCNPNPQPCDTCQQHHPRSQTPSG